MKKLVLSKDRVFLGVCGGLAEYFAIDPVWIRLLFVASVILRGAGIGLYLAIWAIIYISSKN